MYFYIIHNLLELFKSFFKNIKISEIKERGEKMKCKACNGSEFVKVPEFEKQYTVCFSCGEVYSIKYVDLYKLKKYKK